MKITQHFFCSILIIFISAQIAMGQKNAYLGFEQAEFSVSLEKKEFVRLEPIPLVFSISNKTKDPLIFTAPEFYNDVSLRVSRGNETTSFSNLFGFTVTRIKFSTVLDSGKSIHESGLLISQISRIFPEAGSYLVEFILRGEHGDQKIYKKEISIIEPSDRDQSAFQFLNQYEAKNNGETLFAFIPRGDSYKESNPLTEFILNYEGTVYEDFALYRLANLYKAKRQFEKALPVYERLQNSSHSLIALTAKEAIESIRTK